MNMSQHLVAVCLFVSTTLGSAPVSAAIFEFQFTGQYTLIDPIGNVMDQQPISSTFTYNSDLGAGSSAAGLTIDNFITFGNTATIYDISLELISGSLVLGNMLADWGVNSGVPLSTVWDASGMINAISFGLQEGDVISGTDLIRGGDVIFDVGSALPASDNLAYGGSYLNQGPAPLAVTTWNTTTVCTPGYDCIGNAYSGGGPFTVDSIPGSPMIDGPFTGLNVNFDIGSGHSLTVLSISDVPLPASAWLFGTGLLGLIGISRRRKIA